MIESRTAGQQPLRTFEWTNGEDPCSALVRALSDVEGTDPRNMEPLYDTIDPEALSHILRPPSDPRKRPSASVRFEYHNYEIVINENGRGYIYES